MSVGSIFPTSIADLDKPLYEICLVDYVVGLKQSAIGRLGHFDARGSSIFRGLEANKRDLLEIL